MKKQELLKEYEYKLVDMYARANTKSKKKRIVYDLFDFSNICYNHFDIERSFPWETDEEMIKLIEDFRRPFIQNVLKDKDMYNDFSKSVINTFLEVDYPFYDDYYKLLYKLSKEDVKEIILSFLNSYDPKLERIFKSKLDDCEIFDTNLYKKTGFTGLCYPFNSLKKSLIFCEDSSSSIFMAGMLIHEFGHAYEYEIMYNNGINDHISSKEKSPFIELSSRFFEYAFYNYLYENRIFTEDAKICLRNYYKSMLEHIYEIHLISEMDYITINKYGMAEINDRSLGEYASKIKECLNYYELPSEIGMEINFKDAFIYGLGSLFSIYLYENYKEEPNIFFKEFRNILVTYQHNNIDIFRSVGITKDKIIKGKELKKVLSYIKENK